jgi:hypothetical protein
MRQRGRRTAEALAINVDGTPPRLTAPAGLNAKERALFEDLINACDPKHFRASDTPLLVSMVQATLMVQKLARTPSKIQEWERAARVQMALATKLRLSPHSRTDPKTITRQQHYVGPAPWDVTGGPTDPKYDSTDEDDAGRGLQ